MSGFYEDGTVYLGNNGTRRKLNKVTNLLCLVLRYLEGKETLRKVISETKAPELEQFWRTEKKRYAKREQREAARRAARAQKEEFKRRKEQLKASALGKLTAEEKLALGIKTPKKGNQRRKRGILGIR